MITFTTTSNNKIYNGEVVTQTLDEYDFVTEIGAEAWEQGHCIEADNLEEAVDFAKTMLDWQVIIGD